MKRDYPRLPIEEFGRQLITSGDLDPVYIALHKMRRQEAIDREQLDRWLIAYWSFYHCGVASYLSKYEGPHFWHAMMVAAQNEPTVLHPLGYEARWPRGSERRHFRGQQAVNAVTEMATKYPHPSSMILAILGGTRATTHIPFRDIVSRVKTNRGFGDWISFKVADMLDRLDIVPVSFSQAEIFMYEEPTKAALMVWRDKHQVGPNATIKDPSGAITDVVEYLNDQFKDLKAPPTGDRSIGLQEVETVLCKWKSHLSGHYPLYNDIHEINHGIEPWSRVDETAACFLERMPKEKS